MAIQFEYYENPESDESKARRYHPRAVAFRTVETEEIARNIHEASSMTIGDIKGVLRALSDQLAYQMSESNHVHLEGIGYFQPTLRADKEVDPKKTRAQSVWFKSVKFRADRVLKARLKNVATERAGFKSHSASLTNEDVDKKVAAFFEKEDFLTRRKLEALCRFTRTTAARHIRRLCAEGKMKNVNTPRQPIYVKV